MGTGTGMGGGSYGQQARHCHLTLSPLPSAVCDVQPLMWFSRCVEIECVDQALPAAAPWVSPAATKMKCVAQAAKMC